MNYYIDTEFHEYKKKPLIGKGINTIELISIGIVSEDDREYHSLCKEFNLRAAWKNSWLKENVLKPIYDEYVGKLMEHLTRDRNSIIYHWWLSVRTKKFSYRVMKWIFDTFGKTREQIAKDIVYFVGGYYNEIQGALGGYKCLTKPIFYAYYADYDWVVFCWLYGRMIDLPDGFPFYCRDLKQELDDINREKCGKEPYIRGERGGIEFDISRHPDYPKQEKEHSAIDDARWNKKLKGFITCLTQTEDK